MATIITNTFTSYKWLDEEEEFGTAILTIGNRQRIQNEIATIAQQELNISFDPNKPMEFVQEQAFLKGQRQSLQWLLDASEAAQTALAQINQTSPNQN